MSEKYLTISEFNLEGELLSFIGDKPKKPKYLRLVVSSEEVEIKIPKELRTSIKISFVPGDKIRVVGVSRLNKLTGELKLKADGVSRSGVCPKQNAPSQKARIMICQKSGCLKRGGKGLLSELEQTLCDRGLLDRVTIERTNCQKTCSSAPNCILQVGKKQYNKVRPEAIASLLENHFTCKNDEC
ncbi:MAG: (2Fe-2S) ferredoxin domain-containing protein [Tolypothrix brevis GSE-NOS-MK-07-07A]|jgi:(2Fe-2S) ferredoxin|nr:(2Fe-2S) ferredoxin domain-containing protein [Tolypothrix brevis GSE-NOS-MK-07-07A]